MQGNIALAKQLYDQAIMLCEKKPDVPRRKVLEYKEK
jgi:hypothetical protein